jgi:hypothetical protein
MVSLDSFQQGVLVSTCDSFFDDVLHVAEALITGQPGRLVPIFEGHQDLPKGTHQYLHKIGFGKAQNFSL